MIILAYTNSAAELAQCRGWVFWSGIFGASTAGGSYMIEYVFFILFSVVWKCWTISLASLTSQQVLFAGVAAILVKEFATYAKHSGIPEVKTVLGGFVIHRLMTTWTLFIKCLGLVREQFEWCHFC